MNEIAVNAFVVSILSAASGFLALVLLEWFHKKPTLLGSLSGLVAGLVGITPGCGFVNIFSALFIGFICSILCYFGLSFIKYKLKWDDSLDAFSLHSIGGIWGALATGLFANGKINPEVIAPNSLGEGLFISGDYELLLEQIFAIVVCIVLSAVVSFIIFKVISLFTSLRVEEEVEKEGLDTALHRERAYNH